jgi:hypothetical protein
MKSFAPLAVRLNLDFINRLGNLLAKSREEWPATWEQSAAFGTYSDEKSWLECIHIPQTINNVCKDAKTPALQPFSTSFSPIIDTSATFSHSSPSSVSPLPHSMPSSCQIEDSITVQPLRPLTSQNIERDQISNTPDHRYDAHLALLSKKLDLPEDVVSAAKRIILRVEIDFNFRNLYRNSAQITSLLVARAALFGACRQLGIPKTFKEIEIDLPQDRKPSFHKLFKLIDSILKKDALTNPSTEIGVNAFPLLFSVSDFVSSQAKTLGLSDAIRGRAIAISENRDVKNLFSGRQANIGAAVVLAFASACEKYYVDRVRYAQVGNVSVQTFISSLKTFVKFVWDMSKREELPLPFRWNYTSQ